MRPGTRSGSKSQLAGKPSRLSNIAAEKAASAGQKGSTDDPSPKSQTPESSANAGQQEVIGSETAELAQVLDRLQIAEKEEATSSQQSQAQKEKEDGAAEGSSSDDDTPFWINAFKSRLQAGSTTKQALEPVLEAFDLEGVAKYIKAGKAKKIIVMSGAGISVSAGIPDFRSPKTGLYANLQKFDLPHPQAVFELDFFRENPKPFYLLAQELFPGRYKPTPAHYFLKLLDDKGLLLRCFTQNIDSLEREAGLPAERIVAAHGNFDDAHCINCHEQVPQSTVRQAVDNGSICHCPKCGSYVKPDIVFFGENLPENFFTRAQSDFPQADLLIVMGTSLVVHPFASLINRVSDNVPRILINRERVGEADAALTLLGRSQGFSFDNSHRDALFIGDCDEGVKQLAELLGWSSDLEALVAGSDSSKL